MNLKVKRCLNSDQLIDLEEIPIFHSRTYLKPFDDTIICFLDEFSKLIISNYSVNREPQMVALGFWMRKSNLYKLKSENNSSLFSKKYLISPLGKVFHVCPSNVDTMFMYSLTVSLLMGNKNILRISNRLNSIFVKILIDTLRTLLSDARFIEFRNYIELISYDHNSQISEWISMRVNARLLWGGDRTINSFQLLHKAPRVKDIVFADRVSMMILDCKTILDLNYEEELNFTKMFLNDAYTFDQMGCASPQSIIFIGTQDQFNDCLSKIVTLLSDHVENKYFQGITSIASLKYNKLVDDSINDILVDAPKGNNLIQFLPLRADVDVCNLHGCGSGYFYIRLINSLAELPDIRDSKVQTLTYYGLPENDKKFLLELANGEGIDRIVPIGQALVFDYIWDGYNLFDELSKKVSFQ